MFISVIGELQYIFNYSFTLVNGLTFARVGVNVISLLNITFKSVTLSGCTVDAENMQ